MPECRGCVLAMREMKAEARVGHHANPAARNMAKQNCAGRLARADDTHIHTLRSKRRPACIVLSNRSAVTVIDIDRPGLRHRSGEHERGEDGEQDSHVVMMRQLMADDQFTNDSFADFCAASP